MSKRKADIGIGRRAAMECFRLFLGESTRAICQRLGCSNHCISEWMSGTAPSVIFLLRLLECGADVHYILTGRKENK